VPVPEGDLAEGHAAGRQGLVDAGAGAAAGRGRGFGIGGPGGGPYGQLMVNDLIPWVDSNFRTLADRDHRAMAGLSMGGMMTSTVTTTHLDKFSNIGLFSGGTLGSGPRPGGPGGPVPGAAQTPPTLDLKNSLNGVMADPAELNKKVHLYFFSCGSVERPENLLTHQQQLIAAGITDHGTLAAGELITNPEYFAEAVPRLPRGWQKRNLQIVLRVPLVNRVAGRPRVLATHVW